MMIIRFGADFALHVGSVGNGFNVAAGFAICSTIMQQWVFGLGVCRGQSEQVYGFGGFAVYKLCNFGVTLSCALILLINRPAGAVTVLSSSSDFVTPETISQVPAGFGALGGDYLIPDAAGNSTVLSTHVIWEIPPSGGTPTAFASGLDTTLESGLFLPSSYGTNAGSYASLGWFTNATQTSFTGKMYVYTSAGTPTLFAQSTGDFTNAFTFSAIAPATFGSFANQVVVSTQGGSVDAISPTGTVAPVAPASVGAFGLAFAPAGFGTVGGKLLASSGFNGQITAIDSSGNATPFANVPLSSGQTSGAEMAFSPSGFISGLGSLLFVSVRGSSVGGGTMGAVDALNSSGQIVATLTTTGLGAFDPRGLFFTSDGDLLISNAAAGDGSILEATPSDFTSTITTVVPLPSPLLMSAIGLAAVVLVSTRLRRRVLLN